MMNSRNTDRKSSALVLLPLLCIVASIDAFQPHITSPTTNTPIQTTRGGRSSHLEAAPLHDLPLSINADELSSHAHAIHGFMQHHNSLLLSKASATAVAPEAPTGAIEALQNFEATEAAVAADEGWWKAYLNVFKTTIEFVHSGIDEPIHKLGWEGGTWGFSIALFTAGVRSLLIPFNFQQTKATEMMKALKPYVDEINAKFKDNENRKNQLVGKLYQDADQNPLAGCFLSLAQLPLILGLYRGVRLLALDGKLDEPFLWIPSLEGPVTAETDYRGLDWLTQGWTQVDGLWTPQLGWETTLAFCVMPVVLVLGQKLTMEALQPPETDNSSMDDDAKEQLDRTKKILKFLPLLIGFFSLQVPAGLTIYWFTSNLFTLSTALIVRAYYEKNPPEIELPDYWDALGEDENEMTAEERKAAAKAGIAKGPSIEDWVTNANFHTLVERETFAISPKFESWKEANVDAKLVVPAEFQSWVDTPVNGATSDDKAKQEEPVPQV